MAFLKLYDEFLTLDEIRLALYGGYDARLSQDGGGSGSVLVDSPSGAIVDVTPGGVIADTTSGGKIGETR